MKSAWNAFRDTGQVVSWYKLFWQKDEIPSCSFMLWLVCKYKMRTLDRLLRWGTVASMQEEYRDHLYFQCIFANWIWKEVLHRNGQSYACNSWEMEVTAMLKWATGSSFQTRIRRPSLAVVVHCIWQERNQRIFQGISRTEAAVLKDIESYLRAKLVEFLLIGLFVNIGVLIDERIML